MHMFCIQYEMSAHNVVWGRDKYEVILMDSVTDVMDYFEYLDNLWCFTNPILWTTLLKLMTLTV